MNIKSAYISTRKASEVAKVLGLRYSDVKGRYVSNVAPHITPGQAAQIAFILYPEQADTAQADALVIAEAALDDPGAYGWTMEQAEKHMADTEAGWWALGR